jgi:hypothetical protein
MQKINRGVSLQGCTGVCNTCRRPLAVEYFCLDRCELYFPRAGGYSEAAFAARQPRFLLHARFDRCPNRSGQSFRVHLWKTQTEKDNLPTE